MVIDWWARSIAIWGAITGTAALLIHFRNMINDRPKARVRTKCSTTIDSRYEIWITNVRRRPIHTEAILVQFRDTVSARNNPRREEECEGESVQRELQEGKSVTFTLNDLLPDLSRDQYYLVYRVGVRSSSGKTWWSKRRAGEKTLLAEHFRLPVLEEDFHVYGEGAQPITLYLLKDWRGYSLERSDRNGGRRYRWRWRALRAFAREKKALRTKAAAALVVS